MVKVENVIKSALILSQVITPDEELTGVNEAAIVNDAVIALDSLIALWGHRNIIAPMTTVDTIQLYSGINMYLYGPGNPYPETLNPHYIVNAYVSDGKYDYLLNKQNESDYFSIGDKTYRGMPEYIYFKYIPFISELFFWPTPDREYTATISSYKTLINDDISLSLQQILPLPQSYEIPLTYNLAVMLLSRNGTPVQPEIANMAETSLKTILLINPKSPNRVILDSNLTQYYKNSYDFLGGYV